MKSTQTNKPTFHREGGSNPSVNPTDRMVEQGSAEDIRLAIKSRIRSIDPGAVGLFTPAPRRDWSFDRSKFESEVRRQKSASATPRPKALPRLDRAEKALAEAQSQLEELQRQMAELLTNLQ